MGGMGTLPMTDWLHEWLHPVTAAAIAVQEANLGEMSHYAPFGGGEVAWGMISTLLALAIVAVSIQIVGRWNVKPADQDAAPTGFGKILYNKWYVDELYDAIIVRPLVGASRFCWRVIDAGVIDGFVNAVGYLARGFGWFGSLFQTGTVNTYAFILSLGVLVILGAVLF